jgi:hypothetical protein
MNTRYGQLTVELACVVTSQFHMAPSVSQVFSDYNSGLDNLNQVALNWGFDMLSKGRRSPRDAHLSPPDVAFVSLRPPAFLLIRSPASWRKPDRKLSKGFMRVTTASQSLLTWRHYNPEAAQPSCKR